MSKFTFTVEDKKFTVDKCEDTLKITCLYNGILYSSSGTLVHWNLDDIYTILEAYFVHGTMHEYFDINISTGSKYIYVCMATINPIPSLIIHDTIVLTKHNR